MEISVYPDLSVKVRAPEERTLEEIKEKVHKRASWIMEQKYFFSLFLPRPQKKRYISGETHLYLGKKYRLKIQQSEIQGVKLTRGCLMVYVKYRQDTAQVRLLMERWYLDKAQQRFCQRLDRCMEKAQKYGIPKPEFLIRKMTQRWGSCSKNGVLTLNLYLIMASSYCIDYVIVHELCHLKYHNHGKAFRSMMDNLMPDWQRRKHVLENVDI